MKRDRKYDEGFSEPPMCLVLAVIITGMIMFGAACLGLGLKGGL